MNTSMGIKCFLVEPIFGDKRIDDSDYPVWDNREILGFVRNDTGERHEHVHEFGPGAMWHCYWYVKNAIWKNETEPPLCVVLPNGSDWSIDGHCSNCTMKDDWTHRCWPRRGEPPNVTVDKNAGPTCPVGAGSVLANGWHGFLKDGELHQA